LTYLSQYKIAEEEIMGGESVTVVNDKNFADDVLKNSLPVLVDFWAPWCGPCKAIGPVVEEIAAQFKDKIKVAKMNVDESQKIALDYSVRSIPTLILFKEGKILDTLVGLVPKERIEEFVRKAL